MSLYTNLAVFLTLFKGGGGQTNFKTRTNWPRQVRELILDSDSCSQGFGGRPSGSQGVKRQNFRVPGGSGVRLQGPKGSGVVL